MSQSPEEITGSAPRPRQPEPSAEPRPQAARKVEYRLTLEDAAAFLHHHAKSPPRGRGGIPHWFWLIVLCLFLFVWLVVKLVVPLPFSMSVGDWVLVALAPLYLLFHFGGKWMAVQLMLRKARRNPRLFDLRALEIMPEGLTMSDSSGSNSIHWHALPWIVVSDAYAFFYLTDTKGVVLPRRAFASEEQFEEFVATARRYHAEARRFVRTEGPL
jgi:hypothetical protein